MNKNIIYYLLIMFAFAFCSCATEETIAPEFGLTQGDNDIENLTFSGYNDARVLVLKSNVAWSISSDQEWCKVSNRSGEGTHDENEPMYLKVSVDVNQEEAERNALITLTAGGQAKTVKVRQYSLKSQDPLGWETAMTAVYNMKVGMNLGNRLDCAWYVEGGSENPKDYETQWGNVQITPELVKAMKDAGFNAIRVPVTWFQHIDANGKVKDYWMNRVEEVVKYVLDEGMYCILNTHHDAGSDQNAWLRADMDNYDEISEKFAALWTQIAGRFANYDEKLLFEGYNEMLDDKGTWTAPQNQSSYEAINKLAQLFVTTVRATGGNNVSRNLIVNTYSADAGQQGLDHFRLPTDESVNHLIAEVHIYNPGYFTSPAEDAEYVSWTVDGEAELKPIFARLNTHFLSQGIPVIIGEYGAMYRNNESEQAKYASFFVSEAKRYGITCFWWFDIIDQENNWKYPSLKDAIIQAAE